MGVALPDDLVAWLHVCKGEMIGPGGVFGARPDCESVDMAAVLALYPAWRARGWLPVAGDGCGDYYVLVTTGPLTGFVGFVEAVTDPDRIDHVVDRLTFGGTIIETGTHSYRLAQTKAQQAPDTT
jgi:hypothetical protein